MSNDSDASVYPPFPRINYGSALESRRSGRLWGPLTQTERCFDLAGQSNGRWTKGTVAAVKLPRTSETCRKPSLSGRWLPYPMDQPSRFHLHLGVASRTKGDSAARSVAYATGSHIRDAWTGRSHNYSRRSDVIDIHVENFPGRPEELAWLLDSFERRRNSVTAYKMNYATPHVLSAESRKSLNRRIARKVASFLGVPVVFAEHAATETQDTRNTHTHMVFGTRQIDGRMLGPKLRFLSVRKTGRAVVRRLRWEVFKEIRSELIEAGRESEVEHWDPRAHWQRGIDRSPRAHVAHRYFCAQRAARARQQAATSHADFEQRIAALEQLIKDDSRERLPGNEAGSNGLPSLF